MVSVAMLSGTMLAMLSVDKLSVAMLSVIVASSSLWRTYLITAG
jgi:hypothetical protein